MSPNIITARADAYLHDALSLMVKKRISFLVVVSGDKKPLGVITERDIVNMMSGGKLNGNLVREVMSSPVITVNADEDVFSAVNSFVSRGIRHLVAVTDKGTVIGVLTLTNLMELLGFEYFVDLKEVSEIMTRSVVTIEKDVSVLDTVRLMARSGVSCVVITEGNEPVGILTERDTVKIWIQEKALEKVIVEEVMTSPLLTISHHANVLDTLGVMLRNKIRHMPVLSDHGDLLGMVTQVDVTKGIELKYTAYLREIIDDKEKELREANAQLEERVKESTKDLREINRQLNKEIERRKKIEEALRESEERYSLAQKLANVGSWDWDIKSGRLEWSEQIEPLFGFQLGDFKRTYHAFLDCVHPDDRKFVTDSVNASIHEGKIYLIEHRIIWPDGSVKWILESGDVIRDDKGEPIRMLGIAEDVTDRKIAEEKVRESRQQLHNLAQYLQNVREKERKEIARDIHDALGQILSTINLDLMWAKKRLNGNQESVKQKIDGISGLVDDAIDSVQKISSQLRTSVLDDLGLISGIEWLVQNFESRVDIKCKVKFYPKEIELCDRLSLSLFRIVQEAMTNVIRHSDATTVDISLTSSGNKIEFRIKDNGKGIGADQINDPMSLGLIGMRERISPWNGEMLISGEKGKGTTVLVTIPDKEVSVQ